MQSCTCAGGSRPSTTKNLRKDEDLNDEKALDCKRNEVRAVCRAIRCAVQLRSHESVELAHANSFRLATDQLLASDGYLGPQQDPLRRVSRPIRSPLALAAPHDGAVGTDDARGTREVSSRRPRPLWFV